MPGFSSVRARRRSAVVIASLLIALACTAFYVSREDTRVAVAATHVTVDTPRGTMLDPEALTQDYDILIQRAEILGRMLVSPAVLEDTARYAGVPPTELSGLARDTAPVQQALKEPGSEQRANQILLSRARYRIEVQGRPEDPVLDIYTQAPTTEQALRLANGSVKGLRTYLGALSADDGLSPDETLVVKQLGLARGGVVSGGATRLQIAMLTFLVVFAFALALLGGLAYLFSVSTPAAAAARRAAPPEVGGGDWPRTGRLLPWLVAAFMTLVWVIPFSSIKIDASLPIDLELDRLVLPVVFAVWALALAVGGSLAPRLRLTWVHAGVATFVFVAFLSVVVNANYLNGTFELDQALKKLPLLVSYISLFVIAASVIRRREVPAFLIFTLGLAVVVSVGMIWEYRFGYNVFYSLPDKLLPGFFAVEAREAGAVDGIGRLEVAGPAAVPLEAVAMLAMALPIAIVGLMSAVERRSRILYILAACIIMAAVIATFRKSGLIAPAVVGLTIIYFRREHVLKLIPVLVVGVIAVHILSPGALGSTAEQLEPDRLGVNTVSDRAADYDALRPDVWTDLALGRGFGSYEYTRFRILDNDLLHRLVETGVLGLAAYLLLIISVILAARRLIRSRSPGSDAALVGASAAAGFLTVTVLFDVLSFPHATYIFLFTAAIVACVAGKPEPEPERAPRRRPRHRQTAPRHASSRVRPPHRSGGAVGAEHP
jgi:hypothetical protein